MKAKNLLRALNANVPSARWAHWKSIWSRIASRMDSVRVWALNRCQPCWTNQTSDQTQWRRFQCHHWNRNLLHWLRLCCTSVHFAKRFAKAPKPSWVILHPYIDRMLQRKITTTTTMMMAHRIACCSIENIQNHHHHWFQSIRPPSIIYMPNEFKQNWTK